MYFLCNTGWISIFSQVLSRSVEHEPPVYAQAKHFSVNKWQENNFCRYQADFKGIIWLFQEKAVPLHPLLKPCDGELSTET